MNQINQIEGERGIPSVNSKQKRGNKAALIIFVIVALLITGGVVFYTIKSGQKKEDDKKRINISSNLPERSFKLPPLETPIEPPKEIILEKQTQHVQEINLPPVLPTELENDKRPIIKSASSLMASNSNSSRSSSSSQQSQSRPDNNEPIIIEPSQLDRSLQPKRTTARKAEMIGNRSFILSKGTFIADCTLRQAIDSSVAGYASCLVSKDIYSSNGKVVLIEAGSLISGEYEGQLKIGDVRMPMVTSRVETPNGVIVNIDSPAVGNLGAAGVGGYVSNHYVKRFGAALLINLIGDGSQALSNSVNKKGNTNINLGNTSESANELATEALKPTVNLGPTLYKNQGEKIGIYVARDIDFSTVYDLLVEY